MPVAELTDHADDWRYPTSVGILAGGLPIDEVCRGDKWIAGVAWLMRAPPRASEDMLRLPFQSADRLNDWTGLISASCYQVWPDPEAAGSGSDPGDSRARPPPVLRGCG